VRRTAKTAAPPHLKGLIFDLDGTLLLSDRSLGSYEILPGAAELLTELARRSVPFAVLTNGSAYPPAEQAAKLRRAGLPVRDECMLTPSSVAADLMVRAGVGRALILGSSGVGQALRDVRIETLQVGERGERDVQAVEAQGAVATCNSGGAGKWPKEFSRYLVGAIVFIVCDDGWNAGGPQTWTLTAK